MSLTEEIKSTIEMLKGSGIYGCITGSCLLDVDFDTWDTAPDIDIFVYSENALVNASDILMYKYNFVPGTLVKDSNRGEEWKIKRTIQHGMKKNAALSTVKFNNGKVVVNVSYKKNQTTVLDVIPAFDMSIVMHGYDIPKATELDLRTMKSTKNVAVPNPLRDQDAELYVADQWIRQFDRVIKYWNRGFDTRPMAQFYIKLIDEVLSKGSLFTSSKATEYYEEFAKEFIEVRKKIEEWLADKEEL